MKISSTGHGVHISVKNATCKKDTRSVTKKTAGFLGFYPLAAIRYKFSEIWCGLRENPAVLSLLVRLAPFHFILLVDVSLQLGVIT